MFCCVRIGLRFILSWACYCYAVSDGIPMPLITPKVPPAIPTFCYLQALNPSKNEIIKTIIHHGS